MQPFAGKGRRCPSWCPEEYWDLYRKIRKNNHGMRADEARRIIEDHIEMVERRRMARRA